MHAKRPQKRDRDERKETPADRFADDVGKYFLWLKVLSIGQRVIGDVRLEGISIRFDYLSVLIVVRGLSLVSVGRVVAFGRGESLYTALRNVTLAIQKEQWKGDAYHPLVP